MNTSGQKKVSVMLSYVISLVFLFIPAMIYAVDVVPPTTGTGITYECTGGGVYGNCTFNDLVLAVKKATNIGVTFALVFSVVVIAVAGGRYMISGDMPAERAKANKMLLSVVKGIGFILAAWLIVTLITGALLKPEVLLSVPLGK